MKWAIMFVATFAALALIVFAGTAVQKRCEDAGGKIYTKSTAGLGVSASGNVVLVPTSLSLCLTPDGRIIQ